MEIVNNRPKKYTVSKAMVYSCQYHIIFCPKFRRNILTNRIAERITVLVHAKQNEYGYRVINMEITPNHVHLIVDTNPQVGINTLVGRVKSYLAHRLREEFPHLKTQLPCMWTRNKFISTVGSVSTDSVKKYIDSQKGV